MFGVTIRKQWHIAHDKLWICTWESIKKCMQPHLGEHQGVQPHLGEHQGVGPCRVGWIELQQLGGKDASDLIVHGMELRMNIIV